MFKSVFNLLPKAALTEHEYEQMRGYPLIESRDQLRSRGIKHLDRLVAGSTYRDNPTLRSVMKRYKYAREWLLAPTLSRLLHDIAPPIVDPETVFCPVPLHWTRRMIRGFNQAELLAKELAVYRNLPIKNLLIRRLPTGYQSLRSRQERLHAMRCAFRAKKISKQFHHVILIDDLSTTGATLDACACALKKSGVARVEGFVVAHG